MLKFNVLVLVNKLRDCLLGNTIDLASLTHTCVMMRALGGNVNNLLELHIMGQRCYMRIGQQNLTPIIFLTVNTTSSILFFYFKFQYSQTDNFKQYILIIT